MATTAQLRVRESAEWATLLVMDGVRLGWTDSRSLSEVADFFTDGRTIHQGLIPPRRVLEIVPFKGKMRDHRTTFTVVDKRAAAFGTAEDYLADLFKSIDVSEEALTLTLKPNETAPLELFDKHVGTEAIGPAGERRRYPFVDGWTIGDHHIGTDLEWGELPAADVTDDPFLFRGRRVAIYRVFRDDDGTWRPWNEADRRWWGVMQDSGAVSGGEWSFEAAGPPSLLDRQIGTLSQSEGAGFLVPIVLQDFQRGIGVALRSKRARDNISPRYYHEALFTDQLPVTSATVLDLARAIDALLNTPVTGYVNVNGTDLDFAGDNNQQVSMRDDGSIRLRIDALDPTVTPERFPIFELSLHIYVWQVLGWDIAAQLTRDNPDLDVVFRPALVRSTNDISFPSNGGDPANDPIAPPGPSYITAFFTTKEHQPQSQWEQFDGGGRDIFTRPLFRGGVGILHTNLGNGLEIKLQRSTATEIWHSGQLDRPVAPDPADNTKPYNFGGANVADTQGLWLIVGPRSFGGDAFDEVQVAVCSWKEGPIPGTIGPISQDPELVITKWLDPKFFNIPRPKISTNWTIRATGFEDRVEAIPVFRLGYGQHANYADRPEVVMQRIMYSTGASDGWTGVEGDPTATFDTTGTNEPTTSSRFTFDAEVRDLGLAIPKQLMADPLEWELQFDRMPSGNYRRLSLLVRPGITTVELFEEWLRFYAMDWRLHGGKYSVRPLIGLLTLEDVDVVINQSHKASDQRNLAGESTNQELRVNQPINRFEIESKWNPHEEKFQGDRTFRSTDPGVRYRSNGFTYKARPKGVRFISEYRARANEICRFYAKRHFMIRGYPVKSRVPGQDIWPGTVVQLTDPDAFDPTGKYGIENMVGICTKIDENMGARGAEIAMRIDILVQGDTALQIYTGPGAIVESYDDVGFILGVEDSWAQVEDDTFLDVTGFTEPPWSTAGGNIDIKCLSYDGFAWIQSFTATVASVTATPGAAALNLTAGITGTFFRDMLNFIVPREFPNQTAAWALAQIATIGNEDGQFGGGPTDSTHWQA